MRVFAISDIHIDFEVNRRWLFNLSQYDYQGDILILAGDVTHIEKLFEQALIFLKKRFHEVVFVPGNHDLWIAQDHMRDSFKKRDFIKAMCVDNGIATGPAHIDDLSIVPLSAWYDYSFGQPSNEIKNMWSDFAYCKWPNGFDEKKITAFFLAENNDVTHIKNKHVISFSHFVPRMDIFPNFIPLKKRIIYPALGAVGLERQIRTLEPDIHIFGHSHINMHVKKDETIYINNAYGYPYEKHITQKKLLCLWEDSRICF